MGALSKVYPSARAILEQRIGCREPGGKGWALYWSQWGGLTLYPGGEGPQEPADIEEALEWIGGDQPAELTPGAVKYLAELDPGEGQRILAAIERVAASHPGVMSLEQAWED